MHAERRKNRSSSAGTAAQLYLEALAERCQLRGAVLSDDGGLLVAGTSSRGEADTLAAMAPFLAEGSYEDPLGLFDEATGGEVPRVSELSMGSARCFLVILGGSADTADASRALERIFAN